MGKQDELSNNSIFKLFVKYFIPTLIGSAVVVLYNIVDRFFVGKISEKALAGAGIAFYIVMLIIAFSMLIGVGAGTIISLRLGQGKKGAAKKVLGNTITMFAVLGIFLYLVLILNINTILTYSGANSETLPYAKTYLQIIMFAILPLFYSYGLTNVLNSVGAPNVAMFSMLIGAVVNIILDYVAVMILHTGIEGTAYATLIGNVLSAVFVLYFLTAGKFPFKVNLFGFKLEEKSKLVLQFNKLKLDKKIIMDVLSIGMSPFLLQAASSLVGVITNKIVDINGGTYGVAIMTIINSYLPLMTMSVYSVSQAIQPIVGFNYGAKNYERVRESLLTAVYAGVGLSAIFWAVVMIFPKEMVLFFNEKSTISALKEGEKAMRIYFSLVILSSFGIIIPNYFQATGRSKYSVILNLLRQVIIFLIVVIIFSNIFKLNGVWYAQPFTDFVFFIILAVLWYKENKKMKDLTAARENEKIAIREKREN
ncbi:MATE family efflux transporter [Leptotrichia sp. HSP-334]|uniref:Multidrug export protein MepA n=1 Tax=Leptotrichia rugosa TaxID=3239302 RepID=A0AB39VG27_9FUSO